MRIRSQVLAVAAMGAAGAFAQDYPTPSFNCANVMTPQELRICRSQELSELDGRHGSLVERYVRAAANREQAVGEMDAWLEKVRNPCQTDQCLVDVYGAHIRELERIVPAALPQPAFTAPARRDVPGVIAKAALEPGRPAARKAVPQPEPASVDDDEDDDELPGYMIPAVLAAFALLVWLAFRAARRSPLTAGGGRDASGDRQ
jgi:uncharacterized protein